MGTLCCVSQLLYSYSVCHESYSIWTLILQPAVWRGTGWWSFYRFPNRFFFLNTKAIVDNSSTSFHDFFLHHVQVSIFLVLKDLK